MSQKVLFSEPVKKMVTDIMINTPYEDFDLYSYFVKLVSQIPEGKISTFREIAIALGDVVSAAACAYMQNVFRRRDDIPLHRVIRASGELGGYRTEDEARKDSKILREEGMTVTSGRVKFIEPLLFNDFETSYPLEKMRGEQAKLSENLSLEDDFDEDIIGAADVSYDMWKGYAHFVYLEEGEQVGRDLVMKADFPYIPGYLFYREYRFVKKLAKNFQGTILIDGNGILHPRGFGLASETGVCLNKATVGVAKSLLLGQVKQSWIIYEGKKVGCVLGKHSIVSPGHRISLESSINLIKSRYNERYPELLRVAHNNTVRIRKEEYQTRAVS